MIQVTIGCIVEGYGEVEAVPLLIRRIALRISPELYVDIPRPLRASRNTIVKPGELERAVEFVAHQVGTQGGIITLIDADDDCPAHLGPELLKRAIKARSDVAQTVVLAKYEFEAWFLASADSLRGQRGLADDLERYPTPENIRGAKEWLSKQMRGTQKYSETLDQPALAARFDMDTARNAASFDKFYRDTERLLNQLRQT